MYLKRWIYNTVCGYCIYTYSADFTHGGEGCFDRYTLGIKSDGGNLGKATN